MQSIGHTEINGISFYFISIYTNQAANASRDKVLKQWTAKTD